MAEGEKLQKVLAAMGLGSRRAIEEWIAQGRITIDQRVAQLGERVSGKEKIRVDGRLLKLDARKADQVQVLVYNKPEGEVCTRADPQGRPSVFDKLPKLKDSRWVAVGRLDVNTTGLLLFTTDGELANKLMHPATGIDREYLVRVLGDVGEQKLQNLRTGVELDDGLAQFTDITPGRGEGANRWFYVCLMEGRNREVRRLWESQGVKVNRLKRVRYGPVFLPSRLRQGQWEYIQQKDVNQIYTAAGLRPTKVKPLNTDQRQRAERQLRKQPRRRR